MVDIMLKAKLKRLIQHSDWEVIYAFQAKMVEAWNKGEIKADDEFNTMWNVAFKAGKIQGLKEFFDDAERSALDND